MNVRRHKLVAAAALIGVLSASPAWAGDGETGWSATLYAGPSASNRFSDIVDGRFRVTGAMVGLAVDRDLFNLGWDTSVAAEGQLTQYMFKNVYTTGALGIGLRFHNFPWSGASLGIYSGPSYTPNPPLEPRPGNPGYHMKQFLNYISIELAAPIPGHEQHWDAVMRIYHRSGAWGVYSINVDEGSMIGVGLRAKF